MKLKEALRKKTFVVTSEVQAPIDEEPQALIKRLEMVRGRVDGITVPELEVEGIVGDSIKTCEILKQNQFNPSIRPRPETKTALNCRRILSMPTMPE